MKIDGRKIAAQILSDLKITVNNLKEKDVTPKLAVILMGDVESSNTYVRQKELKAKEIGGETQIHRFDEDVTNENIESLVRKLDKDPKVHGIILQRPAPKQIKVEALEELISLEKEVDGFGSHPVYAVPVAEAVIIILKRIHELAIREQQTTNKELAFKEWLKSKKITVIGKGETAGEPIINALKKIGVKTEVIDSKTVNPNVITKQSDIIISAVGKTNVINPLNIKKGVILIGVGMTVKNGRLHGDYEDEEVADIASFYTPTPGGVGPVNVSCLMQNLIEAAEALTNN